MKRGSFFFCAVILLISLAACEAADSQKVPSFPSAGQTIIEGGDLARMGEETNRKLVEKNIRRFKDKYQRHFGGGLYFADLGEAKKKLNEEYTLYLKTQMDKVFHEPYILRLEAEFVNSEVQAYAKGEKTLSEILQSPGENLMSLKGQFFGFRKNLKKEYEVDEFPEYDLLADMSVEYVEAGVDFIEIWFNEYPQTLLEKYPLREMEKQENLFLYLKDEPKKVMSGCLRKTYYDGGYSYKEPPIQHIGARMTDKPYPGRERPGQEITKDDESLEYANRDNVYYLNKKYNMEFFQIVNMWYAPVDHPEMFFESGHSYWLFHPEHNPEGWDYFLGLYYQYLLGLRIDALLEEAGLSEEVLYFVQTEPEMGEYYAGHPVDTARDAYPFGKEGYTEEHFLSDGYTGIVYVNFIRLEESGKPVDPVKLEQVRTKVSEIIGIPGRDARREKDPTLGGRVIKNFAYLVDPEEKRIARELFRKHPLTERADNPAPTFSNVFSDIYNTRIETEGFIYLDIFGTKIEPK